MRRISLLVLLIGVSAITACGSITDPSSSSIGPRGCNDCHTPSVPPKDSLHAGN